MLGVLYLDSNNVIELQALTNALDDSIVTGATLTAVVTDYAGTPTGGQVWPVAMTESGETPGTYNGTLESTIEVQVNRTYRAIVTAITVDGLKKTWVCNVVAGYDC